MLNQKRLSKREALLRRHREPKLAQHERKLREGEARLLVKEQLSLKPRRFIDANIPELTVDVRAEKRH